MNQDQAETPEVQEGNNVCPEMFDRYDVYMQHIEPIVQQLEAACREHKIDTIAYFEHTRETSQHGTSIGACTLAQLSNQFISPRAQFLYHAVDSSDPKHLAMAALTGVFDRWQMVNNAKADADSEGGEE